MAAADQPDTEEPGTSRAAGGCVLLGLAAAPIGIAFAVSTEAGILATWLAATAAIWWAARRRMSDSSAPPPPPPQHPTCRKCAGQSPLSVTPSETQKGMLIYSYELPKRPGHTHIHIAQEANTA
ncbi:hypothetical protein ACN2WE_21405 [Streptomyces sp. cg28]|uniref:hypothetical protein n=1 Tax=Streptomyces sp. cg28 TaxID=3403457 RepID=UPI003B20E84A